MKKFLSFVLIVFFTISSFSQDLFIVNDSKEKSEKLALVILNGFGDSKKNRKKQKEFFENKGYDLFIPEYIERKSINKSIETFSLFYENQELYNYKEVKFLCYIIGGYVLNQYIEKNGKGNISTIIYDRSPTQERAPQTAVKKLPFISKLIYGKVLKDFSLKEKGGLSEDRGLSIGVIIENKATKLMRYYKKTADSYGEYNYNAQSIEPNLDDWFHTFLDHDQMYVRFDIIGEEILYFLNNGVFTQNARRIPYEWDPFQKLKKNDFNL
ncbi:MAG: hypothetical protein CMD02_05430 [Flavobacteriales bacterium]|nr:hypothetical protein [Flavobacteriales bacterium]